jgi:hypothetical protein
VLYRTIISTFIFSSFQFLIFSEQGYAQTDQQCERLYGVTCNHQRDIEQMEQNQRRQRSIEQNRSFGKPSVCSQYPKSMTCEFTEAGNLQMFEYSMKKDLQTSDGRSAGIKICNFIKIQKNGKSANQVVAALHNEMIDSGTVSASQLEKQLMLKVFIITSSMYCPQHTKFMKNYV